MDKSNTDHHTDSHSLMGVKNTQKLQVFKETKKEKNRQVGKGRR